MSLPTFAPREPSEPLIAYASRVLVFLIATECTAVCSDDDLELAKYAAVFATANPEILASAADRITNVAKLCSFMLNARTRNREAVLNTLPEAIVTDKPNIGPMAPLSPVPIVRPPSNQTAKPEFNF